VHLLLKLWIAYHQAMLTILYTMQCAHSKLKLHQDSEYVIAAVEALEPAIDKAEKYYQLKWSIVWFESKTAKKRSVKAELNILAYDSYTYYAKASRFLKKQRDINKEQGIIPPTWWIDAMVSINLAHYAFQEEHINEIGTKQLKLDF
jgi:hypothetical protein